MATLNSLATLFVIFTVLTLVLRLCRKGDFKKFFAKNLQNWHFRSDFFQNLSLHIFFRGKIPILEENVAAPSGGQTGNKKFLLPVNSEVFTGIKNTIIPIFRTGFLKVFDLFKQTVKKKK